MKKKRKVSVLDLMRFFLIFLLSLALFLITIRTFSFRQLDDVSPEINCQETLLKKSGVLYVIPKFNNVPISENKEWCKYILSLNKTLGLHGVYHTYEEFSTKRDYDYLQEGIEEFEKCFGFKPEKFKPPQLKISDRNKELVKRNMKLDSLLNDIFHKVYHCEDSGKYPNWIIDLV